MVEIESKDFLERSRQTMALSIKEGSFAGLSMVLGDSYITPFALTLEASVVQIGIMNSISGLVLPLGQILGSRMMVRQSRKIILSRYAMLQAMMWLFIIGTGILFWLDIFRIGLPFILMFCVFLYNFFGGMVGPAWVSMMGDIIPESGRGKYFGKRNLIVNIVALTITIVVAFLLQYLNTLNQTLLGFLIIFTIASIMRFISSGCFRYHYNPPFYVDMHDRITLRQFLKTLRSENFGIFTLFMNLVSFAQWIAGPFFGVYMLQILQFNFSTYILVIISSSLFSLFLFKVMGRFADSYGNRQLLKFGSLLIPISPLLWIFFSTPLSLIFGAQLVSGLGWTAFNLASANFIYDNVPASKRGEYMAYYSLIVGVGIILGGLVGSGIMFLLPFTSEVNYKIIFALSGILRAVVIISLFPKLKEVRVTNKYVFNPRNAPLFRWLVEWRFKDRNRNGKTKENKNNSP